MTIYRYDSTRHAMVAVSATNEWPYAKLPPSVGAKPKRRWGVIVRHTLIYLGAAAGLAVLVAGCASTPPQPAPTTTAGTSKIVRTKRPPMTPAERVQRVFDGTASQATGMAGSNASRAVRVTGNAQIDTLLSGAVRNGVTELRGWWRDQP